MAKSSAYVSKGLHAALGRRRIACQSRSGISMSLLQPEHRIGDIDDVVKLIEDWEVVISEESDQ